nr:PD-(D/E)XK nuclease family protein [Desulfobacula sp.]
MSNYVKFFENINEFKERQKRQMNDGLNDYNLLTSVLAPHDEVRLHSRMIYSLLNPEGKHYQDTFFLEKFIEAVGLQKFSLNISNAKVHKEYKNIDLYISDGEKTYYFRK